MNVLASAAAGEIRIPALESDDAAGLSRIVPGAGFDTLADTALALGWPYFGALSRGPDDDSDAAFEHHLDAQSHAPPPGVAARLVRLYGSPQPVYTPRGFFRNAEGRLILEHDGKPTAPPGPLTIDEVSELFRLRIARSPTTVTDLQLMLLTEALLGPSGAVEAVVRATERAPNAELAARNAAAASQTHYLGFGLLRVDERQAAEARGRLGAVCERVGPNADNRSARGMLDVVLLRRRGAEARGWAPWNLLHVYDDAEYVAACLNQLDPESAGPPLARLLFTGGPPVGEYYLRNWQEGVRDLVSRHDTACDEFVDEFSPLSSAEAAALITIAWAELGNASAEAWVRAHLGHMRARLEEGARQGRFWGPPLLDFLQSSSLLNG